MDTYSSDRLNTGDNSQNNKALPGVMLLLLDKPAYKLTVAMIAVGHGQVLMSPSGGSYPEGTKATLTAEPTLGSAFTTWGGDAVSLSFTCQVTMTRNMNVTASFGIESLVPRDNQAILGPLAGTVIRAYRLGNLSSPIEGPFLANNSLNLNAAGSFDLSLTGIPDDEWILVTATGGWDIDADDNNIIDPTPVRNQGTLNALAKASWWRQGGQKINALTDIAWRYTQAWVGQTSITALEERLDQIAQTLLIQKIDTDPGDINIVDLLRFTPGSSTHLAKLSFDYDQLLEPEGFIALIHADAESDAIATAVDLLFGSHLGFALPDNLETEVQVRLSAFGKGRVVSDDGNLLDVLVDAQDTELLAQMQNIAVGWYVAGMSDKGPFLMKVTAVTVLPGNQWQLTVIQASLEEVILTGTGTLNRSMTHGDLVEDAYALPTRSATGELLPVRLLPSKDPDDRVFRLQVGNIPDPDPQKQADVISGELIIKDEEAGWEVKVNGEVEVTIDVETGLSYGPIKGLEYFKFVPMITVTKDITLTCSGAMSTPEKKKKIHTFNFASIKFMAGLVPVWISPIVDIYIGVEGKIEAAASMGFPIP